MDLTAVINEELAKLIEGGAIRQMVQKHLTKSIESAIEDALRSYGDFGKALAKQVKEAIGVELASVDMHSAALGLGKLVEAEVNRYVTEQTHPLLKKQLDELFQPAPATITLQELIDTYKDDERDSAREDGHEYCGLIIRESENVSGWIEIGLNPSAETRELGRDYRYETKRINEVRHCEIQIHAYREKGTEHYAFKWISFAGHTPKTTRSFLPSVLRGMSRKLFQMYAAGTRLVLNEGTHEDGYDTAYPYTD